MMTMQSRLRFRCACGWQGQRNRMTMLPCPRCGEDGLVIARRFEPPRIFKSLAEVPLWKR
jgi:predicted RNA-binding Zn-ribbon protein involved in translation (DUF1610 family)